MNSQIEKEQRIGYKLSLFFTLMSALFIVLSPQFFGGIFALVFIIPVYMGLNGLKRRRRSGWLLGMAIIPVALSISILWIRYVLSIINNLQAAINEISIGVGISQGTLLTLIIGGFVLSIILFILVVFVFIGLIKNRNIFR